MNTDGIAAPLQTAAIILGAGEGRRRGGPKALALLDGMPFLTHVVEVCREGGCDTIWTVVRPSAEEVEKLALMLGTHLVENPDPDRGMFSSVQAGVRAALGCSPQTEFLIFPVDHPRVQACTVTAILRVPTPDPSEAWVVPHYEGHPGHPVRLGTTLARRLLDLPPTHTLRTALRAAATERIVLPVQDPAILENMN